MSGNVNIETPLLFILSSYDVIYIYKIHYLSENGHIIAMFIYNHSNNIYNKTITL